MYRSQNYRRAVGLTDKQINEMGYSNHHGKWRGFPYDSWSCCKSNELHCPAVSTSIRVLNISKAKMHSKTTDDKPNRPERLYLKYLKKSAKSTISHQETQKVQSHNSSLKNAGTKSDKNLNKSLVNTSKKFIIKISPSQQKDYNSCLELLQDNANSAGLLSCTDNQIGYEQTELCGGDNAEEGPVSKSDSAHTIKHLQRKRSKSAVNRSTNRKLHISQPQPVHSNAVFLQSSRSHQNARKIKESPRVESHIDPIIRQSIGDKRLRATLAKEYSDTKPLSSALLTALLPPKMSETEDLLDSKTTVKNQVEVPLAEASDSQATMEPSIEEAAAAAAGEEKATQTTWPTISHAEPAMLMELFKQKLSKEFSVRSTSRTSRRLSTPSPSSRYYFSPAASTSIRTSMSVGVDVTKRFGSDHFHGSTAPAWVPASKSADLSSTAAPRSFNRADALTPTRRIDRTSVVAHVEETNTRVSLPKPSICLDQLSFPSENIIIYTSRSVPTDLMEKTEEPVPQKRVPEVKQEQFDSLLTHLKEDIQRQTLNRHRDWLSQVLRAKELHEERGYYKNTINSRV